MDTLTNERAIIRSLCKKAGVSDQLYHHRKKSNPDALLSELLLPPDKGEVLFDIPGVGKKTLAWLCDTYNLNRSTMRGRIIREYDGTNIMNLVYAVSKVRTRKPTSNTAVVEERKPRKEPKHAKKIPDLSHLAYDENLHFKRLVASLGEVEALKRIKVF